MVATKAVTTGTFECRPIQPAELDQLMREAIASEREKEKGK